jgi:hypothetical protein
MVLFLLWFNLAGRERNYSWKNADRAGVFPLFWRGCHLIARKHRLH